jgi:hypothetical protein
MQGSLFYLAPWRLRVKYCLTQRRQNAMISQIARIQAGYAVFGWLIAHCCRRMIPMGACDRLGGFFLPTASLSCLAGIQAMKGQL